MYKGKSGTLLLCGNNQTYIYNVLHVQRINFGTAPDIMIGIGFNFLCICRWHHTILSMYDTAKPVS